MRPVTEEAIARIDAYRARRIGQMIVSGEVEQEFDEDPVADLLDLAHLDGKKLLEEYKQRHAKYGTTPFDPDGNVLRLYPGGVTIWSGFPGSGKTTILRQLVCHCLSRGSSVFLASLEENPRNLIVDLAAVGAGTVEPNAHQVQWFIDAYAERFRLFARIGMAEHRRILALIRKVATQGVRHVVIDSLMKLDISNDDLEGQRKFANLLSATAMAANVHIHLVAHPRKLVSAEQELDLNDVAGTREIGGIADNVIFVRRITNKSAYGPSSEATPMSIGIKKQRYFNGALGSVDGFFHRKQRQFHLSEFTVEPTRYLPNEAYE